MSEQKPVVAAYQYQFDGPYGPVWRNDSGPWNGQTPIATRALYAAPPAQPARQLVSVSSIDIERMITECLPGGHSCDPQQVADAIRQYCNAAQPAQRLSFVQATAPRAIWLQVSDEADDNKEAFPDDHEGITWCQDSALMCEVKYVRADLAAQPAQAQPARLSDERIDEIASAMFYADEPMDSMARAFRPQWLESIARPLAHAIAAAVVPPGFVVVPEEPTEAMKEAVGFSVNMNYMDYLNSAIALHAYRAMIAAAKATK